MFHLRNIIIFVTIFTLISVMSFQNNVIGEKRDDDEHDAKKAIGKDGKNVIRADCPNPIVPVTKGTNHDDFIIAGGDNMNDFCSLVIDAKKGNDEVLGAWGSDVMYGKDGADTLQGSDGNDELYGGNDDDNLAGGFGSNLLYGGNGNDKLFGSEGDDQLAGGNGRDTFYCGIGIDEIKDYEPKEGDYIIDKGGSLNLADEAGCEIGVNADFKSGTTESGKLD